MAGTILTLSMQIWATKLILTFWVKGAKFITDLLYLGLKGTNEAARTAINKQNPTEWSQSKHYFKDQVTLWFWFFWLTPTVSIVLTGYLG